MNPLHTLLDAGLSLRTDRDRLIVTPASLLDDSLRDLIRKHKPELWAAARDAETVSANLIEAIRPCCRLRGDTDTNIAGLNRESGGYSTKQQRDLTAHFNDQIAIWSKATGQSSQPAALAAQPRRHRATNP